MTSKNNSPNSVRWSRIPHQIQSTETTIASVVRSRLMRLEQSHGIRGSPITTIDGLRSRRNIYYYSNQLQEPHGALSSTGRALARRRGWKSFSKHWLPSEPFRYVCFFLIGLTSVLALLALIRKQRQNKKLIQQLNTTNGTLGR